MKVITIVSDSLGMVRPKKDTGTVDIMYRDLYANRLQEKFAGEYNVVFTGIRGATSKILNTRQTLNDLFLYSQSNTIIIQIGICDCAPRLICRYEELLFKFLGVIKLSIIVRKYVKIKARYRTFFTKYFPFTYVSLELFEKNLDQFFSTIKDVVNPLNIIFVNIADTNEENKKRSHGFDKNIKDYNQVISRLKGKYDFDIVDFNNISKTSFNKYLLSDGIHITKEAHYLLSEKISKLIIK